MGRLVYDWSGNRLRLTLEGVDNHELRTVLLGFWRRLPGDDQADFITELTHYLNRGNEEMPGLSQLIAAAGEETEES